MTPDPGRSFAFAVGVDPTWEDQHLPCCVCGAPVLWRNAVLLPTATHEDGDITGCTLAHVDCPEADDA